MLQSRINVIKDLDIEKGPVIYWMQRDQRVKDNWALIHAYEQAEHNGNELLVVFNLVSSFHEATLRQYHFMIEGLKEVEVELAKLNIPFHITTGKPEEEIPKIIIQKNASLLITDFNPLKIILKWKLNVKNKITTPFHEVDAHNIVPVWETSDKLEFAAYTIRPKINKKLPHYLDNFPKVKKFSDNNFDASAINWDKVYKYLKIDNSVKPVNTFVPGTKAANRTLKNFIENKLEKYGDARNDPNKDGLSKLSPYLHFGQISAQRIALALNGLKDDESVASFLEELIVRRELSDNFCYYNENYDNFDGFHKWAKETLNQHRDDEREYLYELSEFENAETHDPLWNAAQNEMMVEGKMHGYMRMYWAKKILEWTESPEKALEYGIYLNDKYSIDGRDPNGYVGIAWSIGGVHDRAWTERPVFGKIRFMNYNGCKRKFDVKQYIKKYNNYDQTTLF